MQEQQDAGKINQSFQFPGTGMPGYVYILTNPSMRGLIKVGSSKNNVKGRVATLSGHTGVPTKFVCRYCYEVSGSPKKAHEVFEKKVHEDFSPYRQGEDREFFRLKHEHARVLLEGLAKKLEKDKTWHIRRVGVEEDGTILDDSRPRVRAVKSVTGSSASPRAALTFPMVSIRRGSKLIFTKDRTKVATVVDEKEIEYKGKRYTVSGAAQMLLNAPRSVRGSNFWEYQGETLTERRDRMEGKTSRQQVHSQRTTPKRKKSTKREPFTFRMVNIRKGSKLTFTQDRTKVATVVGDREVEYRGKRGTLSGLAQEFLNSRWGVQGPNYWEYQGETLAERRDRMEGKTTKRQATPRRGRTASDSGRAKPRPRFLFSIVGVPIGSTLTFSKDSSKAAKVVSDKEIEYKGRRGALSQITLEILQQEYGSKGTAFQGPAYWKFEGETLAARRDRLEGRSK